MTAEAAPEPADDLALSDRGRWPVDSRDSDREAGEAGTYDETAVGVVVPAHNEEEFVGTVIDSIPPFVDRIYAVDDGSTDDTWAEIRDRAELLVTPERSGPAPVQPEDDGSEARVVGVRHGTNRGRGGAVKSGYRRALADGMEVVAVIDGDGQMNPAILDRIIDPVVAGDADYAKGTRLTSATDWSAMSGWRLFGNALLTGLTRIASGYWQMTDSQNGYTAISASALRAIDIEGLYAGYGFLNDVLTKLNVAGLRVANVPMRAVYGDEQSGIRYGSFVPSVSLLLLQNFLWRLRCNYESVARHPITVLYALGTITISGGIATLGLRLLSPLPAVSPLLASGTTLVGLLSMVVAMVIDRRRNASLEVTVGGIPGEEAG